jgi:hypothetical protein
MTTILSITEIQEGDDKNFPLERLKMTFDAPVPSEIVNQIVALLNVPPSKKCKRSRVKKPAPGSAP